MITEVTIEVPFQDTVIPCKVWAVVTYETNRCDTDRGVHTWETVHIGELNYEIPEQPEHCRAWLDSHEAEKWLLELNIK